MYRMRNEIPSIFLNTTYNENDIVIRFWKTIVSDASIDYMKIALYVFIFIYFVLPVIGISFLVILQSTVSSSICKYYSLKYRLKHGKPGIDVEEARKKIVTFNYWIVKIWFGYEVIGFENLPIESCMTVSTHGPYPVFSTCIQGIWQNMRGAPFFGTVDKKFLEAFKTEAKVLNFGAWSREECVDILKNGNDYFVCPGAHLEVRFSDESYKLNWGERKGFAKVAKDAKAKIIPFFTVNLNEAFWTPFFLRPFFHGRFAPKNLYVAFVWGGLPVKLTSIIGKPIPYDESHSVEEIAERVKKALGQLRDANQRLPGNKFQAVLDRFRTHNYKTNIDYAF